MIPKTAKLSEKNVLRKLTMFSFAPHWMKRVPAITYSSHKFAILFFVFASFAQEKEAALGVQVAKEVGKNRKILDVPAARQYLDLIGRQISPQLPGPALRFTFEVFADPFETDSLPGGYVSVPSRCSYETRLRS